MLVLASRVSTKARRLRVRASVFAVSVVAERSVVAVVVLLVVSVVVALVSVAAGCTFVLGAAWPELVSTVAAFVVGAAALSVVAVVVLVVSATGMLTLAVLASAEIVGATVVAASLVVAGVSWSKSWLLSPDWFAGFCSSAWTCWSANKAPPATVTIESAVTPIVTQFFFTLCILKRTFCSILYTFFPYIISIISYLTREYNYTTIMSA